MPERFESVPHWKRRQVTLGGAVLRLWLGLLVLVTGLGLAIATLRTPGTSADIEQLVSDAQSVDRSVPAKFSPPEGRPLSAIAELRAAAKRQSAPGEGHAPVRPAASSGDRSEAIFAGQSGLITAERLIIAPASAPQPDNPVELARALQIELRRVGCYQGEIDGDWGPGSKRAMSSFNDRVNATLPIDQPDSILLAMVQRHEGQACGKPCRAGETRVEDGKCVPTAALAREETRKKRMMAATSRTVVTQSAVSSSQPDLEQGMATPSPSGVSPLPGRMGVGVVGEAGRQVPVTREGAEQAGVRGLSGEPSQQQEYKPRVAERSVGVAPPLPYYRPQTTPGPRKRPWTQTIFEELSRR
jgi:hypothetical protein